MLQNCRCLGVFIATVPLKRRVSLKSKSKQQGISIITNRESSKYVDVNFRRYDAVDRIGQTLKPVEASRCSWLVKMLWWQYQYLGFFCGKLVMKLYVSVNRKIWYTTSIDYWYEGWQTHSFCRLHTSMDTGDMKWRNAWLLVLFQLAHLYWHITACWYSSISSSACDMLSQHADSAA